MKEIFVVFGEVFKVSVVEEGGEYRVCLFDSFGHNTSADYFTDDEEDAKTTANAISKQNVDHFRNEGNK